jgi:hypothetical protein
VTDGIAIFEYQPWKSYVKRKNESQIIRNIFPTIQIKPDQFESVLTEIGFDIILRIGPSVSQAKGFSRPILVMRKVMAKSRRQAEIEKLHETKQLDGISVSFIENIPIIKKKKSKNDE